MLTAVSKSLVYFFDRLVSLMKLKITQGSNVERTHNGLLISCICYHPLMSEDFVFED